MSTKTQLVVKSNHLIEASYKLDLAEQRIILMAIFMARESKNGITADSFLTISAHDFANLFGIDIKTAYDQLKSTAVTLYGRNILLRDIHTPSGKEREIRARWVSAIAYVPDAALIQIQFSGIIVPYITKLEREFTSYKISMVAKMTSIYAIRLYELLIQWGSIGSREIELDELKFMLGIQGEYAAIKDLKRRVIDPAVTQISEHTDLTVRYENVKSGKTVVALTFLFEKKKQPLQQKQPVQPMPAALPPVALSLAERDMLKQVMASTGQTQEQVLRRCAEMNSDIFLALDQWLRQLKKSQNTNT